MIGDWLQPLCAVLMSVALAAIIGAALLQPILQETATTALPCQITRIYRYACTLLAIALLAYSCAGTVAMTDTGLIDLPASLWLVVTQSHFGAMIWCGLVASLLLIAALTLPVSISSQRGLLLVSVCGFAYSRAATGHAADHGWVSLAMLVHTVHLLAAATWVGSVGVGVLLTSRWQHWPASQRRLFAHRVSEIATLAFVIVVSSGLLNIVRTLGNAQHPWDYAYTWILLAKLAVIIIAAGLGAWNRWYWLPRLDLEHTSNDQVIHDVRMFRIVLLLETVVLCTALLIAAKLGVTMPAQ
ncbi:copper resistance D family protein [Glaciimonas soli]|uniref:Copper resistance protein D domain-containing protein n=1 Tax=Glaciimonas soli TaxID=2590999 RepID=A0A843YT93_9BURK|nr:CopD family protein [Glaciimonas soli]MQR02420.1 hypothetical protein [Glaciimonas soli]